MPQADIGPPRQPVRAAQYMRMSTEHQRYSMEHQSIANSAFALEQGYDIVRSYTDAGVSGLRFEGRNGLKSLLTDIVGGVADFEAVIVYDVSRWGRFQDPDEAAHYEFLCRSAGVSIVYSAEAFASDGSLSSVLAKYLKRAMAAEYSRELSVKVARAQRALSAQGYWRGGACTLGFRRCVTSPDGASVRVLEAGERNPIHGHRVKLVEGPPEEIALVRRIFKLFAFGGMSVRGIAQLLNEERDRADRAWSPFRVRWILQDEKYVGVLVYGRRTCDLKRLTVHPRERWLRVENACPPLVSRPLFDLAQTFLLQRRPSVSDDVLIAELRAVLETHGRLSCRIIQHDDRAHCPAVYINRFGGLSEAYRRVGYEPSNKQQRAAVRIREHKPHLARPRQTNRSAEEMLDDLRELYRKEGRLNARLIQGSAGMSSETAYRNRFGSLRAVYELVGYEPTPRQREALKRIPRRSAASRSSRAPSMRGPEEPGGSPLSWDTTDLA